MKGLYHYTSTYHLPEILNSGFLKLTRGILDDYAVWFTTSDKATGNGLEGSIVDKSEIRFILKDIPAIKWKDYRKKIIRGENKLLKQRWADALEIDQKPHFWWLTNERITLDNVQAIENTKTGERVELPATIDDILLKLTTLKN